MKPLRPSISSSIPRPPAVLVAVRSRAPSVPSDRKALFYLALLLAAFVLATPAEGQVTLYRDVDFRGPAESFHRPVADLRASRLGNDRASAVEVAPGCTAILYRDSHFRGRAVEVRGALADLRGTAIGNDRVSSLDLRCGERSRRGGDGWIHRGRSPDREWDRHTGRRESRRDDWGWESAPRSRERRSRGAVVLFRDSGFRAPRLELGEGRAVADLEHTPLGNDRLSSISVPPGCSAILFEDSRFRGRSIVVRGDVADLGRTAIGNDRVSSIDVRCR